MKRTSSVLSAMLLMGAVMPFAVPTSVGGAEAVGDAAIPFDFDGDGYADLAVGVADEDLGSVKDAGAVQVLYGSTSGPTARDQLWHQGRKGVRGAVQRHDMFGETLDSGDFNGDGFADLAVGIPRENVGKPNAGAVQILYGSPTGLTAAGDQVWHQGSPGVPGRAKKNDRFGSSLTVGDFDDDGYVDLVIGVPWDAQGGVSHAGRVVVLRGSTAGLTADGVQSWSAASAGIAGEPEQDSFFGEHLAAGDVTGDGHDDLVIGARGHSATGNVDGAVHLLWGSGSGLTSDGSQHFLLATLGEDTSGTVNSLWLGDVNADGYFDLASATYNRIDLLHGHAYGVDPGPLLAPCQPGKDCSWAGFGSTVASGDVTGDGYPDLVITAGLGSGPINVAVGTADGLGAALVRWPEMSAWGQPNILPLSGGSHAWIVLGNWTDHVGGKRHAGSVTVLRGTRAGTPGPATTWSQNSPGIRDRAEKGDEFGRTVG